ncbi:MAG: hypothetical protein AMS24_03290 [Chlamydiae bacterium SM23_39]|nr:MAG: hypothetical protein AMS24_03290 [Chlamydiae bacterium SM23_39]
MDSTVLENKKKFSYFRRVLQELKKVSWTSKEELIKSTKIVVISTFISGIGVYVIDIFIRNFMKIIGKIAYLVDVCINGM